MDNYLKMLTKSPGLWQLLPASASQSCFYLSLRLSGIEHRDRSPEGQQWGIAASLVCCTMRCTTLNLLMTRRREIRPQMSRKNRILHIRTDLTKMHTSVSLTQLWMVLLIATPICNYRFLRHQGHRLTSHS